MRPAFVLDGTETEAWLARTADGFRLHVDGASAAVALVDGPDGCRRLLVDGLAEPVVIAADGDDLFVHLGGTAHHLVYRDPVRRFAGEEAGGGADVARAPMPGTVVRIAAAPGQPVVAGDPLVVIESMKLETTIRAWHDGVVADILVAEGQSFERDAVLVRLAAEAA